MRKGIFLAGAIPLLLPSIALATPDIRFNGFMTAGGVVTDTDDATFLGANKDVSFEPDSVVGLQLTANLIDNVSVTTQLIANGQDDFDPDVEWAFLSYGLTDNTNLRMGRLRIPFFMISDYLEVGYAYPWVRPPIDVYGQLAFSRYNGLNVVSLQQWGNWSAALQGYFGTTSPEQDFFGDTGSLDVTNLWGFNLTLSYDELMIRIGHTEGDYDLVGINQIDSLLAGLQGNGFESLANRLGVEDKHGSFSGIGVTWDSEKLLMMAEYTLRSSDGLISDTEGWYVMAGYRSDQWLFHITVSELTTREDYRNVEQTLNGFDPSGNTTPGTDFVVLMTNDEQSVTLGTKYTTRSNVIFKLELQHIELGDKSSGMLQNLSAEVDNLNVLSFTADVVF